MSGARGQSCCAPGAGEARSDRSGCGAASRAQEPTGAPSSLLRALTERAGDQLTMARLPGGTFLMGSEDHLAYPQDGEGPVREVDVEAFAMATTTVTVAEFAAFVAETGHRTDAEVQGDSLVFQGLLPADLRRTAPRVTAAPWWCLVAGACWYAPEGPNSSVRGREQHPVTHVSHRDARAYAQWAGARLPGEEEWEYACRGGLAQQPYPWGAVREPAGRKLMNIFPGDFPEAPQGAVGTVAVRSYPPNGFGLYETTGNVWEWTAQGVLRGGSYMCHASYCRRYRTSARTTATPDTSLGHTGFRLASDL